MSRPFPRQRLAALLAVGISLPAFAGVATVRRAEESTLTGTLTALHDGRLTVTPDKAGKPTVVPLDDIVDITLTDTPATRPAAGRPAATGPATQAAVLDTRPWQLKLTSPDTLTVTATAWNAGRLSGSLAGKQAVDLPINSLRELWCGTAEQIAAAKALGETAATDDIAFAVRDKKVIAVHGVAQGVSDGALQFKFDDQTRTISLARLVGVVFAKAASPEAAGNSPQQAFTLSGGDSVPGTWTGLSANTLTLTTAWGQAIEFDRPSISKILFRNGRVVSLSDLKPAAVEQTPYFDRLLPWQVDRSLDGKPLLLADGPVARGLAVHSRTVLSYSLDGAFAQFRSHVGFQLPAGKNGQAVVRVTGDGKTLYEKTDANGTAPPFDVNVNVAGVRTLSLEVDFGANQDVGDRVVWGNARLLRTASATTQPANP
ncbi:MAG: NPCBM/NEW2 domain-containing protein [Tepidisphaeraceae bacterium]